MKKILALVLALTLALGTFSFAAAAPSDVVGTDYEDAVGKLTYLGIIAGFPDGTYKPAEPVTRAQFAKIIVTALGVGEAAQYAAGTTKFSDVPADHWASGYINVAVDLGIINGYPDGTFAPENTVTFAEAIKMIVAALGYTPKAEAMGGYPGGYLAIAAEKEITEDITVVGSLAANRGDIALMINNALDVDMMEQVTWGQYPEYKEVEGKNLLGKLGVDEVEGIVTSIPRIDSKLDDNEIRIDAEDNDFDGVYEVISGVDFEIAFGNEVTAYIKKDKVIGLTIESDFFIDAIEVAGKELTLIEEDEDYDFADDFEVWLNGKDNKGKISNAEYDYAKVVLNDDGDVVFLEVYTWDDFMVVEEVDDDIVYSYGEELDVEDYTIVKDGKVIEVADLEEGDILFYRASAEFAEVYNNTVVGKIGDIYATAFEVDGVKFNFANTYAKSPAQFLDDDEYEDITVTIIEEMEDEGDDVTVYQDRKGDAVFVVGNRGDVSKTTVYGYLYNEVKAYAAVRTGDIMLPVDIITSDGEKVQYDVNYDDLKATDHNLGAVVAGNIPIPEGDLVKLKLDSDGDVVEIWKAGATDFKKADFGADHKTSAKYIDDTYRLKSGTKVFLIADYLSDNDEDDIEVVAWGDIVDFEKIFKDDGATPANKSVVYYDDDNYATFIVAALTDVDDETDDVKALIYSMTKLSSDDVYRVKAYVDGEVQNYYTKDSSSVYNAFKDYFDGTKGTYKAKGYTPVVLKINKVTGDLDGVEELKYVQEDKVVNSRSVADRTIEVNSNDYLLVDDYVVFDATDADDIEVMSLRDIQAGDTVSVISDKGTTSFARFVILTKEGDGTTPGGPVDDYKLSDAKYVAATPAVTVDVAVNDDAGEYALRLKAEDGTVVAYKAITVTAGAFTSDDFSIDLSGLLTDGVHTIELVKVAAPSDVLATISALFLN